mmetsp:Transcript_24340/g.36296  ORF Transcript_24340/g.36296 Transcript_24340/m.36296 type:complete len:89 (-) Transcript_24340:253-519(-)
MSLSTFPFYLQPFLFDSNQTKSRAKQKRYHKPWSFASSFAAAMIWTMSPIVLAVIRSAAENDTVENLLFSNATRAGKPIDARPHSSSV